MEEDIVERLRLIPPRWSLKGQVHYEAADEIERLREALQKIAAIDDERLPEPSTPEEAVLWTTLTICVDLARKATGGE